MDEFRIDPTRKSTFYERKSTFYEPRSRFTKYVATDDWTPPQGADHHNACHSRPNLSLWFVDTRPVLEHAAFVRLQDINVTASLNIPQKQRKSLKSKILRGKRKFSSGGSLASFLSGMPKTRSSVYYDIKEREGTSATQRRASFLNKAIDQYHKHEKNKVRWKEAEENDVVNLENEIERLDVIGSSQGLGKMAEHAKKGETATSDSLYESVMAHSNVGVKFKADKNDKEDTENKGPKKTMVKWIIGKKNQQGPLKSVLKPRNSSANNMDDGGIDFDGSFCSAIDKRDSIYDQFVIAYRNNEDSNQNADTDIDEPHLKFPQDQQTAQIENLNDLDFDPQHLTTQTHVKDNNENELRLRLRAQIERAMDEISSLMEENAVLQSVMSVRTDLTERMYLQQNTLPEVVDKVTSKHPTISPTDVTPFRFAIYILASILGFTISKMFV